MNGKNILSLQALRGIAAIMVVFHHTVRALTVNNSHNDLGSPWVVDIPWLVEIGSSGVDIFFVLSGFIMIYISSYDTGKLSPGKFILNRLERIYPIYFLITLFICLLAIASSLKNNVLSYDLMPHRLMSFLFVPTFNEKGLLQPILGVGWTLNYEMYFYLVFSLSMIFGRKLLFYIPTILITALYSMSFLLADGSASREFLGNAIVFEFCFGMFIGYLYVNRLLPPMNGKFLVLVGLFMLVSVSIYELNKTSRLMSYGLSSSILFLGFLLLNNGIKIPNFLVKIGNASYSIYLLHVVFIYQFAIRMLRVIPQEYSSKLNPDILSIIICTLAVLLGIIFYKYVEKPVTVFFKQRKVIVIDT